MRAQGASSRRHWLSAETKRITRLGTGTVTKMGPYLSTSVPGLRHLAAVDATGTRLTSTALPTLHTSVVALRRRLSARETESLRLPGRPSTLAGSSLRFTLTARLHVGWLCRRVGGPSLPPRKSPVQTVSGSHLDVDIAADTRLACLPDAPSWPGKNFRCPGRWLPQAALLSSRTKYSSTGARVTETAPQLLAPAHYSGMYTAAALRRALRGRSWRPLEAIPR